MKKQILLTALALTLAAGSIFAFVNNDREKVSAKAAIENCPPDCCTEEECCVE